ncbi:unnamed protein product [Medioppia subpectinata]|uniref:Spire n=1 Tax=Medioppia subpectinata TaxID=1979941 RepID=A0A7R9KVJ6_9ACAR|nr:unnamed protein product [Medioppia subpectinata]CAG2110267.1 unnamed protein product [Medioppia subpectinata]
MADIRSGVPLNRVEVTESERNKDAHELILDFIRARPSLQSAERRQLAPPPLKQETLYEKLMFSIRQKHKLKPVPKPAECAPPADDGCSRVDRETTPAPQRRLIKANLRLSFESFDDTTTEDDANDVSETTEDDGKRFSLKKLSRLLSQERRHSISVCETPREELDVNEDARQHVVSIWESCDWGRALQCLSLSLQEVQHIRNVLTKAELETLAVTKDLRSDLENGKICFTCLKTRFSFFGQWPRECQICKRVVCERCATKMHIPFANFDKVPIYMLSPTPSPPEPRKPFPEPRPQTTASAAKRWRSLRSGDAVLVDAADRKSGPLARVCRDCKRLVRHLIDAGAQNWKH